MRDTEQFPVKYRALHSWSEAGPCYVKFTIIGSCYSTCIRKRTVICFIVKYSPCLDRRRASWAGWWWPVLGIVWWSGCCGRSVAAAREGAVEDAGIYMAGLCADTYPVNIQNTTLHDARIKLTNRCHLYICSMYIVYIHVHVICMYTQIHVLHVRVLHSWYIVVEKLDMCTFSPRHAFAQNHQSSLSIRHVTSLIFICHLLRRSDNHHVHMHWFTFIHDSTPAHQTSNCPKRGHNGCEQSPAMNVHVQYHSADVWLWHTSY